MFPACNTAELSVPALLHERGVSLRPARESDLAFLRALYASTRVEEFIAVPWPAHMREAFFASQFDLQHRHYVSYYADADFLVIEGPDGPIGRYYLHRGDADFLILDISLIPTARGEGVGSALIAHSADRAQARGHGVQLHVRHDNLAARRLYERLGFVIDADAGSHLHMRRPPMFS